MAATISSSLISLCQYANVAALAAAIALAWCNVWVACAAAVLLISLWVTLICLFRGNARRLKAPKLHVGVPFYVYLRPIVNALYAIRGYRMRESNFTWQRLK